MALHVPSTAPAGPVRNRLLTAALYGLALLALIGAVHPDALFGGKIYWSADAANYDHFRVVGDAWRAEHGDYPEWNPYLFAGMPTYGTTAYRAWAYPVGEVFNVLQNGAGFPPMTWLVGHLLLGGAGMIWLLGRWGLPPYARVLGAAVWILFPKATAWAVHGHGSKLVAAMYMPWILGLTLEAFDGRARKAAGWIALLLGLQLLRAHPQITWYTILAILVVALARWIGDLASGRRGRDLPLGATGWGLAALVAAALVGAVSILPVQEYSGLSVRGAAEGGGAAYEYATGWSLSPRELGTLLMPSIAGFGQGTYVGAMPFNDYPNTLGFTALILAVLAWADRRRWAVRALVAVFVVSVLVSFGKHFPVLYDPFYNLMPFFNRFRIPSMILVLAALAVSVLAAVGARRLVETGSAEAGWRGRLSLVLTVLGVAMPVASLGLTQGLHGSVMRSMAAAAGRPEPSAAVLATAWGLHAADLLRIGLVLLALGLGLRFAFRGGEGGRPWLGWLLVACVVVELLGVDARITHPERSLVRAARDPSGRIVTVPSSPLVREWHPGAEPAGAPAYRRLASALGHERVWPLGRDSGLNDGMTSGVRSLGGYHPTKLAAYETIRQRLYNPDRPAGRVASWLGASRLSLDQAVPADALPALAALGAPVDPTPERIGDLVVYRNRGALSRARLVHRWGPTPDEPLESFLDRLQAGELDPAATVLLDSAPEPVPAPAPADILEAPVEFVSDGLDEIVLVAEPASPAILVLADMNHPGWEVTVDGEPRPLLGADHVLRGVALEAGRHEVRFVYHDPSLRWSLKLTIVGVLMASILLFLGFRAGRPATAAGSGPAHEG